jgi:transposase
MSRPLSIDLRQRIADALDAEEESQTLIAECFQVSVTSVERISRRVREGRGLAAKKPPGPSPILKKAHREYLRLELQRDPYVSSYELTRRLKRRFRRLSLHRSTVLRAMHALGFSHKKNSVLSST